MKRGRARPSTHDGVDYWTLAQLRYYIRRFLRTREMAAQKAGVAPQQYLLLLQLKGLADTPATIGTLAERLQLRHHSTVGLVDRLVERGMVARTRDPRDRRGVQELRTEGPALLSVLRQLIGGAGPAKQRR